MNPNEPPPKEALPPTADEIARQRRARLEAAVTPQGSSYSGRRERYTPPPDYPLQPCDFKKWAKFDSLPIERACFVLLGYEPPPLHVLKFVQDTYDPSHEPTWDAPPDYNDVLASLRVSIAHGNISVKRIREGQYETKQVTLPDLVRWARTKEYAIAPELEPIIAKMGPATSAAPAQQDTAAPAPVEAVGASGVIHSTKARRNTLTPVIEFAQTKCSNPQDTAEVWAALLVLAEKKTAPLIGATEDGLQYLKGGTAEIFTRKSLGQRLARYGPTTTVKAR